MSDKETAPWMQEAAANHLKKVNSSAYQLADEPKSEWQYHLYPDDLIEIMTTFAVECRAPAPHDLITALNALLRVTAHKDYWRDEDVQRARKLAESALAASEVRQKFEACVMCVTGKSGDGQGVEEAAWTHIRGSYSWRHPLLADHMMSIECTCPGFVEWENHCKNGGTVSLRDAFSAGIAWQAKQNKRAGFGAADIREVAPSGLALEIIEALNEGLYEQGEFFEKYGIDAEWSSAQEFLTQVVIALSKH